MTPRLDTIVTLPCSNLRLFAAIACLISGSISAPSQILIDTFAGGHIQSGVPAQNAGFGKIIGITRDPNGNLVFCDTHLIRRINADGTIQTIAGQSLPGYGGDGGRAVDAILNFPEYPKYDRAGNLYFLDSRNFRIRLIDTSGIITTVAGTGIQGTLGADGPATQAQIGFVVDLAVDAAGYVYFAERSYYVNNVGNPAQVRRVTPSGRIELYAGCSTCTDATGVPATQSGFSFVTAIAADQAGNLYLSDGSHILRVSSDGVIHNFAGFGDRSTPNMGNGGPALQAPPSSFIGLAADSSGSLWTEEQSNLPGTNGAFIIRRIGTDGVINVVAGTFTFGPNGDGPALQTYLNSGAGIGLSADASGTVTFAEGYKLRQLTAQSSIKTIAGGQPKSAPDGTKALDAWFVGPNSITFNRAGELYIGQSCIIQKIALAGLISKVAGDDLCSDTPNGITSLAVDSHNQVYFADLYGSVYTVSTAGVISSVAPFPSGTLGSQNGFLPKIVIDSQDRIYLISYFGALERITPGSAPQIVSSPVDGLFSLPRGGQGAAIAADSADNVYVCCGQGGTIYQYAPDLSETRASVLGSILDSAMAVDTSSNIWMGLFNTLTKGTLLFGSGCCSYGDGGPAESAYISPSGMAFAPNGDLYILDSNVGRIRRIHGSPPATKPTIEPGGIVNAASYAGSAIAPGELISIFGTNFGPAGLDISGPAEQRHSERPSTMSTCTSVSPTFPANRRAYAKPDQRVRALLGRVRDSVQVIVDVDGVLSEPVTVPVAASAFGISTHDASGSGQGAIFNQDGSLNSHANPAARGSIVTLFGTGEGVTSPALPDGALVISTPYSEPQSPVIVKFGDQTADVHIRRRRAVPAHRRSPDQRDRFPPASLPATCRSRSPSLGISTTRTVTVAVQ